MSPHDHKRLLVPKSRTVTPELSDVSSTSEGVTATTPSSSPPFPLSATPSMCIYCFDVLIQELLDHRYYHVIAQQRTACIPPELAVSLDNEVEVAAEDRQCPLFVTWDKQKKADGTTTSSSPTFELRGCIGTLQPKPMTAATFQDYALTSGLRDRRFYKIAWSEVSMLRVAVSLLVQFEECQDCCDWTVGVHGIVIRFAQHAPPTTTTTTTSTTTTTHNSSTSTAAAKSIAATTAAAYNNAEYSATYLPEVASEQGWDQMTAVKSLIRKAGYRGVIDQALLRRIHCTRYQSSKTRMTYAEYVQVTGYDPVQLVQASFGGDPTSTAHHHHHALHHHHHHHNWNPCNNL